ncbi:beta-galactosidase [Deinococcus sp. Arct2-2]|uniref:beta-galactosidase n=1 Tax=Deinococcus sp. Arct2-2 TaxID=2568653 RepID=UPI0010A3BF02|nr:beta-galactosidase [Deinococcus sp. Arct2-2]THF70290.1 beta-galactosidase [Deinococcus sp. Arct2-2]
MTQPQSTAAPHLLLATCDYPEHVPRDRWEPYARQQRELGLRFVRIAEFAWSRMEPAPGVYDWTWLDEAVAAYAAEGLGVVLCTPTATPPAWLIRAHPEILPFDEQGRVREFGSRRHYDFASPVYRQHSQRITQAMADRYGQHSAVVGWQTDNEFACHDTGRSYGGASAAAFPGWLERKYSTLDALNLAWGNVFWSMDYTDWAQIRPPNLTVTELNPSHVVDFYRFASDMVAEFQAEQVAILRQRSPGRFITHNFMIFEKGFDHYAVAKGLDFVTWDNYPTGMLEFFAPPGFEGHKVTYARTGHPDLIGFNHDLYRGMLRGSVERGAWEVGKAVFQSSPHDPRSTPHDPGFWVMEQQCGQVNWAPHNPLPADGAVQLWTAQAWAHGADVVSYFRWRAATMAQEVMHSGLLRHDETPDRGHAEVGALVDAGLERFPLGPVPARVALLHDYDSLWLYDQQKHSASLNYWAQVLAYYSALRSLGVDVDVISANSDLTGYALVVAPAITLVGADRAARWTAAVRGGVHLLCGPRTAFRTPGGETWAEGQFGPLTELIGAKLGQYDSMRPGLSQEIRGTADQTFEAQYWAESYRLSAADGGDDGAAAEALYRYVGGPLDGQAAVIRRAAGQGQLTVIGAHSPDLIRTVLEDVLAGVNVPTTRLPDGVRISRRAGHTLVQNWLPTAVEWQGKTLAPVSFEMIGLLESGQGEQ